LASAIPDEAFGPAVWVSYCAPYVSFGGSQRTAVAILDRRSTRKSYFDLLVEQGIELRSMGSGGSLARIRVLSRRSLEAAVRSAKDAPLLVVVVKFGALYGMLALLPEV
jgi:hypothetical protein